MTKLENLTDEQLEQALLDAWRLSGRAALARVTAIRTVLKRRADRYAGEQADANAGRALALVNATRGPGEQLTEIDPSWAASIVAEPEWAPLYRSDAEMSRARERRTAARSSRGARTARSGGV